MSVVVRGSLQGATLHLTVIPSRFDAYAARAFKEQLDAGWTPVVERVVLDLGAVEFLDSSGVGALLGIYKRLPPPASLRLINVRPAVQTVIELLRLHRVFELSAVATAA